MSNGDVILKLLPVLSSMNGTVRYSVVKGNRSVFSVEHHQGTMFLKVKSKLNPRGMHIVWLKATSVKAEGKAKGENKLHEMKRNGRENRKSNKSYAKRRKSIDNENSTKKTVRAEDETFKEKKTELVKANVPIRNKSKRFKVYLKRILPAMDLVKVNSTKKSSRKQKKVHPKKDTKKERNTSYHSYKFYPKKIAKSKENRKNRKKISKMLLGVKESLKFVLKLKIELV